MKPQDRVRFSIDFDPSTSDQVENSDAISPGWVSAVIDNTGRALTTSPQADRLGTATASPRTILEYSMDFAMPFAA
jgi:hypothetical protein